MNTATLNFKALFHFYFIDVIMHLHQP